MKKILLLGSQHGNEPLGELLLEYISSYHPKLLSHIDYIVGNPRAKAQNVRFIESDLNRSFNGMATTYEERRATEILHLIKKNGYLLVLDLHTTTCNQPPCLIAADPRHSFMQASHIPHIVHMNHAIVASSLIGASKQAISVEANIEQIDSTLLSSLCQDIYRFIENKPLKGERTVYEIADLLLKSEVTLAQANTLVNFEKSEHGFYPVLTGENSYKKHTDYLGFKAYVSYQIKV